MAIVTVVEMPEFRRRASAIMSEAERMELIDYIARNATRGVSLGGGVRKVRFARSGSGKSAGYRVIYVFAPGVDMPVFLITAFAKNEKANLSRSETEAVKALGKKLVDTYRRKP